MAVTPVLIAAVAGGFAVLVVLLMLRARARWHRWEAVLEHVAKTFSGRYQTGYKQGLVMHPGHVKATTEGRDLSLEIVTRSRYGSDVESKLVVLEVGSGTNEPAYLGPPRKTPPTKTKDFSKPAAIPERIDLKDGPPVEGFGLSTGLRAALADNPDTQQLIRNLIASGGRIEHGTVIVENPRLDFDPEAMVRRIREVVALGTEVARHQSKR